ncbi:MAG: thioesterase family protein [Verrucomicrobiia bacterium]|jgi:acyl-CoA thioester hydrolase
MNAIENITTLRVRYSETDQMGGFYNSRVLEWFECGRTEMTRKLGVPYSEMETRGLFLPLVETHIEFVGRARYDDELRMTTRVAMFGRARVRFEHEIVHAANGAAVARGYTLHACLGPDGKLIRPPAWFVALLGHL